LCGRTAPGGGICVAGYPEYQSATPPVDSDHDGMPDDWEKKNDLNPDFPSGGNLYTLSKNYTNLEVYLNSTTGIQ